MTEAATFHEAHLGSTPIRDLGLTIAGTPLEPVVERFLREVEGLGLVVRPHCYLSTEWGVPFGTVAIAIPFYLARPELVALHEERTGFVEGTDPVDILRYLRHELGHVVNYAYRLYDREDWVTTFGAITQPYREEYEPQPFSRSYVRHLPGWYAQKHPDEDWAETFAVWMTPRRDWRREYQGWKGALAKLRYVDRLLHELRGVEPLVSGAELDEDVGEVATSLDEFYGVERTPAGRALPGIEGALRTVFLTPDEQAERGAEESASAIDLLHRLARSLPAEVYRWTGHFPEHTRDLLAGMARCAEDLGLVYPQARQEATAREVSVLVTALAMTHVQSGAYLPQG